MKLRKSIIIIAAATLTISVSAQTVAHDNYIGVSFGGGLNTALYKPANGTSKVGMGFDASLFYARFFNQTVGLGFGLDYSWANAYATYNWNEVTPGLTHASNPNIDYTLTTGFNDFVERQNVGVVSIPVEVLFRKAFNRSTLIGGVGLSVDFPVHGAYYAKGGNYKTSGMFPSLGDYTVENMPEHGFSTYNTTQGAKINNRAKVGASVIGDLGVRVALNDNWGMYFGIYAGYGFTNLLAEAKADEMIMVNPTNSAQIDYRGTFDSNQTSKANLLKCGVKIAIDFGWPVVDKKALEAERIAREQFVADSIANEQRIAAEKAAREKAEAERIARQKAEAERIAAEKAAREKAEAERIAAEKAFKQRVEGFAVHFDVEGAKLNIPEAEKAVVDELCEKMKADRSINILITGHTDNYGDPRQNLEYYGMRRAEALKAYMVQQGVDASQIKCDSKGQNEPVAPNDTRANRALNRRANITIL
jgi:outer membrane protein OmpA-like peptidoglycan-associated protein